jgi:hypothetical protein
VALAVEPAQRAQGTVRIRTRTDAAQLARGTVASRMRTDRALLVPDRHSTLVDRGAVMRVMGP